MLNYSLRKISIPDGVCGVRASICGTGGRDMANPTVVVFAADSVGTDKNIAVVGVTVGSCR